MPAAETRDLRGGNRDGEPCSVFIHVCVCGLVCVRERETENKGERERELWEYSL